jgi:hypothetical protein
MYAMDVLRWCAADCAPPRRVRCVRPQGLKPTILLAFCGTAKAVPLLQSPVRKKFFAASEAVPFQSATASEAAWID